jgi:Uma2 family endonuclease
MVTTKLMTAEELERLPDDEHRYDLIRGELLRMAPAGGEHGEIASHIDMRIAAFVYEHRLGKTYGAETGFYLQRNPDTVLAPDAAFVRQDRLPPREARRGFVPVAPDLVVEIVSPSDSASDVSDKVTTCLDADVRLVWVVEPRRRTVSIYLPDHTARILREDEVLDGADVLPGFRLPIAELFAD